MQNHDFDVDDTEANIRYFEDRNKKLDSIKKNLKFPEGDGRLTSFKQVNRQRMIVAMVCEAIEAQYYDIACDVTQSFITDLLQVGQIPIFSTFFEHFRHSTEKYEAKLYLISLLMPLMTNKMAQSWLKIIEEVLGDCPNNSIYKHNINPIRTGLQLYKAITQVEESFDIPSQTIGALQATIEDQLCQVVQMYKCPLDILQIFE